MSSSIKQHLLTLLSDYADFNTRPIERHHVPTPADFAVQVSKSYPRIYHAYDEIAKSLSFKNQDLPECPAIDFDKQDWLSLIADTVEIAVTPHGRADDLHPVPGLTEEVFLTPANIQMSLAELFEHISAVEPERSSTIEPADQRRGHQLNGTASSKSNTATSSTTKQIIYYLQSQNSNLTTHSSLAPLLAQNIVPSTFAFAHPALAEPEAINIWMGDDRSITSLHRDPYENLYLVLKGSKTFTLYPPVDEIVLPTRLVRTGKYTFDATKGEFDIELDPTDNDATSAADSSNIGPRIPWIPLSPPTPLPDLLAAYPLYIHARPRTVTVHTGEILYLPSGWFHHVTQTCGTWKDGSIAPCIAVNWWFDADYDGERYVMRELMGRLIQEVKAEEEEKG